MWKLLFSLLILRVRPRFKFLDTVLSRYRVKPWDLDANVHMNNVKYLKYLEKGRVEHMIHTPYFTKLYRRKIHSLIVNTEVSYIKSLLPFQRFSVSTRISSWDDKYVYYDQRVESQGELYAAAVVRMVLMANGKKASPLEVFNKIWPDTRVPALPMSARKLNELVQAQRQETQAQGPAPQEAPPKSTAANPVLESDTVYE